MLSQNATTRNSLLQVSRVITILNYEKHALRVSRVIAVLAKSACKHAIFLATRVKYETPEADGSFFQRMNLSVSGVFLWSQL